MNGRPLEAQDVAVVIAVKDGERFVARAIESALAQPEAREVWVVDDGSSDATAEVARGCDDRTGRLHVVSLGTNRGPSVARNVALDKTSCTYVTILDADDFLLPGRLSRMFATGGSDWDILADDLIMTPEPLAEELGDMLPLRLAAALDDAGTDTIVLTADEFIESNVALPGRPRKEYGFLKPVIRVDFVRKHGLRYDETLRLAEDYELYARALIKGARFEVIPACGYVAVMRSNSLSREHATAAHAKVLDADRNLLLLAKGHPRTVAALRQHQRHTALKYEHRRMLDDARVRGRLLAALRYLLRPMTAYYILKETVRLKIDTRLANTGLPPSIQFLVSERAVKLDPPPAGPRARALPDRFTEALTHAKR